jgi:hypothetical protein
MIFSDFRKAKTQTGGNSQASINPCRFVITANAAIIGFLIVVTPATAPAIRLLPSMMDASSSFVSKNSAFSRVKQRVIFHDLSCGNDCFDAFTAFLLHGET